jgi:hypothetical protein
MNKIFKQYSKKKRRPMNKIPQEKWLEDIEFKRGLSSAFKSPSRE